MGVLGGWKVGEGELVVDVVVLLVVTILSVEKDEVSCAFTGGEGSRVGVVGAGTGDKGE